MYMVDIQKNSVSMLVLSCDAYSDLWDDFFNLRDKFWPDCEYKWYVVTESKSYERKDVEVIKCGKEMDWAGRFRYAVQTVATPYIGLYLEDFFIKAPIDNNRIKGLVAFMHNNSVDYIDLGNVFHHKINQPEKKYFSDHLVIIDKHLRYGIDTAASLWDSNYLLEKLGSGDYNAWKFEKDRCDEAATEDGYNGLLLADDRLSFNVSEIPVVVQGKFYPPVIKDFRRRGYEIDTSKRKVMSPWEEFKYDFKRKVSHFPYFHKQLKWIGSHFFGYKFFT